ncbi:hypothetical protein ACFCY8_11515 [Streptomyces noursei]|uniref:hypothetical protein n=1 Tax=Streptomyces noursei TaxID=1971 RepID=UPI0035D5A13A
MTLPERIPTSVPELTVLIAATPDRERYQIADRLAAQIRDQARAFALYEEAERDVLHGEECERLRRELAAALSAAQAELRKAEGLIARLSSPQVFDIEYAEGTSADDLLHMVINAHRATRIAVTLQKTIA